MPRSKKPAAKESSKADLIRQTAETIGKSAKAGQIVATLKEQGVVVQYGQVRQAIGVSGSGRKRRRGKAVAKAAVANEEGAVSKAERIRQTAKTLGKRVRPREIIAELAKAGITVSSTLVSKTLATSGFRRRRRRRKTGSVPKAPQATSVFGSLNVDALLAAKALIEKVGGIENAQAAINTLKRLQ